jgi:hypothetical protein
MYTEVQTRLTGFDKGEERTKQALELLLEDSGAKSGHLFLFDSAGLFAAASVKRVRANETLVMQVQQYLETTLGEVKTITATGAETATGQPLLAALSEGKQGFAPVLLWDSTDTTMLLGVALIALQDGPLRPPRRELVRIIGRCLKVAGDSLPMPTDD